jgi:hypothetical protein
MATARALARTDGVRRQLAAFEEALEYWHMASEIVTLGREVHDLQETGKTEQAASRAREALAILEPMLEAFVGRPTKGWFRTKVFPRWESLPYRANLQWLHQHAGTAAH